MMTKEGSTKIDCCEDLTGCKNPKTSQGNQTICIGVNEGVQVNLIVGHNVFRQRFLHCLKQLSVLHHKPVQTLHLNFDTCTISIQTTPLVFRHVSCQTEEIGTDQNKDISKLLNILMSKSFAMREKLLNTLFIVCEAFDKSKDSPQKEIINMFCQNIVKNVPSFGSPSFNLILDFIRFNNLENTCAMRYSESTKCIFKVAKRLFGGATLRKNETQIIAGKVNPGFNTPVECEALLPIPSETILDQFQPLHFEIPRRLKRLCLNINDLA